MQHYDTRDYIAKFQCTSKRCGHVQLVKPASVYRVVDHKGESELRAVFGSGADHCDKCDRPVTHLGPA